MQIILMIIHLIKGRIASSITPHHTDTPLTTDIEINIKK